MDSNCCEKKQEHPVGIIHFSYFCLRANSHIYRLCKYRDEDREIAYWSLLQYKVKYRVIFPLLLMCYFAKPWLRNYAHPLADIVLKQVLLPRRHLVFTNLPHLDSSFAILLPFSFAKFSRLITFAFALLYATHIHLFYSFSIGFRSGIRLGRYKTLTNILRHSYVQVRLLFWSLWCWKVIYFFAAA